MAVCYGGGGFIDAAPFRQTILQQNGRPDPRHRRYSHVPDLLHRSHPLHHAGKQQVETRKVAPHKLIYLVHLGRDLFDAPDGLLRRYGCSHSTSTNCSYFNRRALWWRSASS